mmetsp:Transcript_5924/g.18148  ORF Transcript_5924/g.18148 Transcript_5924/m.18148 type:complete len:240 (-) Transcript_5924:852-1571(-)
MHQAAAQLKAAPEVQLCEVSERADVSQRLVGDAIAAPQGEVRELRQSGAQLLHAGVRQRAVAEREATQRTQAGQVRDRAVRHCRAVAQREALQSAQIAQLRETGGRERVRPREVQFAQIGCLCHQRCQSAVGGAHAHTRRTMVRAKDVAQRVRRHDLGAPEQQVRARLAQHVREASAAERGAHAVGVRKLLEHVGQQLRGQLREGTVVQCGCVVHEAGSLAGWLGLVRRQRSGGDRCGE